MRMTPCRFPTAVAAAWVITRIGLVLTLLIPDEMQKTGDITRYGSVADALLAGDAVRVWEYPIAALAVVIPPALAGTADGTYLVAFIGFAAALDLLALFGILLSGIDGTDRERGAWLWTLGVPSLGVVSLTRLDMATCTLVALSVALYARGASGKPVGFLLSLGALIKLWPVLLLATVVASGERRARQVMIGAGAALGIVLSVVLASGLWHLVPDFVTYQGHRGLHVESLAALPLLWLDRLGLTTYSSEFHFGAQQLVGPGTSLIAAASVIAMFGGLTLLAVRYLRIRKAGGCTTEQVLLFASAGVLLIILTSKVLSPQYLLWLLVLYSLMLRSPQLVTKRAETALLVATLLTHLIFPYLYSQLVANALPALAILTARDLLLVYLFVDLLSKVNTVSRPQSTIRPQLTGVRVPGER